MTISAEVHSDDHRATANFDAVEWFKQATDDEIEKLKKCDWGGSWPSDWVARYMIDLDDDVSQVFEYIHTSNDRGPKSGFECHVNSDEAEAWLKANKPELAAKLFE